MRRRMEQGQIHQPPVVLQASQITCAVGSLYQGTRRRVETSEPHECQIYLWRNPRIIHRVTGDGLHQ